MTEAKIAARRLALRSQELLEPPQTWYISFAEKVFLGGCFVKAHGPITAIEEAHDLGINPGGHAMVFLEEDQIPAERMNKLLSKEDLGEDFVRLGDVWVHLLPPRYGARCVPIRSSSIQEEQ